MTKTEKERLMGKALLALRDAPDIPIVIGATAALSLVANLQLALRHPGNTGASAIICRQICEGLISRLPSDAQILARLGYDPRYDA